MISCPICKNFPSSRSGTCRCGRLHVSKDLPALFIPETGNPLESDYLISVQGGRVAIISGESVCWDPPDPDSCVAEAILLAKAREILDS